MKDCHQDMIAFHNQDVTLPEKEQSEMRDRRNANRRRLKDGLKRDGEPSPIGCRSQGSYAMRTMVQDPNKDYDIDDGVYFYKDDLKGRQEGDKSPTDAKEMVRKAIDDGSFKRPPERLKNCVRVYYDAGYHLDVPVYRSVTKTTGQGFDETVYELASTDWKDSDPLAVTTWFLDSNKKRSPDAKNGGQLRRIVRLLKCFARSRPSWRDKIAPGFMITRLVVDEYLLNAEREDTALYNTMVAIRDRLNRNLEIAHPTIEGQMLTKGPEDARAKFLRDKLDWAIAELDVLFEPACDRKQALKTWGKVFDTTFFGERDDKGPKHKEAVSTAILIKGSEEAAAKEPVDKRGGGRYA